MKREDFVFCIGYQGDAAIVDAQAKKKYGSLSTAQLTEKGFFRAAFCSALFNKDEAEITSVIDAYNRTAGTDIKTATEMKRLLGVNEASQDISKVMNV